MDLQLIIIVYVDDLNFVGTKYPLSTPIVGRSNKGDDLYHPRKEDKELIDELYLYLAMVRVLLYLAISTRSDIAFAISVLARHNTCPIIRHWNAEI